MLYKTIWRIGVVKVLQLTTVSNFISSDNINFGRGEEWGTDSSPNCYNETEPITKDKYWGRGSDLRMMKVVESTIEGLSRRGVSVQILNVNELSEYRKDGHPSVYRKQWEPLSEEQLANPSSYADCIHWCLPGVPDVWNELLYAYILSK